MEPKFGDGILKTQLQNPTTKSSLRYFENFPLLAADGKGEPY
jgi:hypothetical protein